jgi:tetratricopeptide (TPR) repeat protein
MASRRVGLLRSSIWALSATVLLAGGAWAASNDVHYGPAPKWVDRPPAPTSLEPPAGAPIRVIYVDNQTRVTRDGEESHSAYLIKILKPEALAIGNLTATWNPSTDDLTINGLKIIRDGKTIDVLAQTKFRVIERENNLDYAMLDGALTASLQTPGLQVGDELEFAMTILRHDTTFGGRSSDIAQLPLAGAPGAFNTRLVWEKSVPLRWKATPDLGDLAVQTKGGDEELDESMRDPSSALLTDGAPSRFNMRRVVMFSTFESWSQLSNLFAAMFDQAAALAPGSPLHAEAAKIAAATSDPKLRAEAALRLVQDGIRYVFVGLNGGAYRPADADETWRRRFGDCKAKTVLLMALLRELGVASEPVLVNSTGGDLTPKLLPTPMAFDHVVVRATIAGHAYWLDGTRTGDRRLETAPAPISRWGLPIRQGAADIEAIPPEAPLLPQFSVLLDIDATGGFDKPAKVRLEEVLRGDEVQAVRAQLAALSPEDAQRAVKALFHTSNGWADADTGAWRYDESQQALILTATGTGKPGWEGDAKDGRTLDIADAGFTPPDRLHRPKEQDQTAPWLTRFPRFRRWTTIVRLPPPDPGKHWDYTAKSVDTRLGGVAYWRQAQLSHGIMRTTMSIRTYLPEISSAQAKEIEDRLPTFDNKVSRVLEVAGDAPSTTSMDLPPDSKDTKAIVEAARRAIFDGRLDEADILLDRALSIDPKFLPALTAKLDVYQRGYQYSKAFAMLDTIAAADPKADLRAERANLLYQAGRTDEATKLINAWLVAEPSKWTVVFNAAELEGDAGLFDQAIDHVDAGLKLDPDNASLLRMRASLEERQGRHQTALTDEDAATRLRPEDRGAFIDRGKILVSLKRLDEALADLDEAWRIDPLDSNAEVTRGTILSRLGRATEATAMYDEVVMRVGSGEGANDVCWMIALADVDLPRAEALCAGAVKAGPSEAAYWDSYGLVALRDGRLDVAKTRYDHALALNPRLAPSLYARGIVKLRQGDKAGGASDIAAAKALDASVARSLTEAGVSP